MNKRPTIVDVARRAGVSKSTVSNVLRNSPLVKPATREIVERAMTDLDYVYNRSAANLRGGAVNLKLQILAQIAKLIEDDVAVEELGNHCGPPLGATTAVVDGSP